MTFGETWESCLEEIRNLPSVKKYGDDVVVSMYNYDRPSYTGCVYEIECYFPTWAIPKDHKVTKALEAAYHGLYGDKRIGAADTLETVSYTHLVCTKTCQDTSVNQLHGWRASAGIAHVGFRIMYHHCVGIFDQIHFMRVNVNTMTQQRLLTENVEIHQSVHDTFAIFLQTVMQIFDAFCHMDMICLLYTSVHPRWHDTP